MSYIAGPIRPAGGGGSSNSFATIQTPLGTSPTATSPTDVLSLGSSDGSITITGDSGGDTVDFTAAIENASGSPSGSYSVDWNNGALQSLNLSDNLDITVGAGRNAGNIYVLRLVDAVGGNAPTWSANVIWASGVVPGITVSGDTILVNFYYDGTNQLATFAVFPG